MQVRELSAGWISGGKTGANIEDFFEATERNRTCCTHYLYKRNPTIRHYDQRRRGFKKLGTKLYFFDRQLQISYSKGLSI